MIKRDTTCPIYWAAQETQRRTRHPMDIRPEPPLEPVPFEPYPFYSNDFFNNNPDRFTTRGDGTVRIHAPFIKVIIQKSPRDLDSLSRELRISQATFGYINHGFPTPILMNKSGMVFSETHTTPALILFYVFKKREDMKVLRKKKNVYAINDSLELFLLLAHPACFFHSPVWHKKQDLVLDEKLFLP